MIAGAVLAGIHAVVSIHLRADQILSGTGVWLLGWGLTGFDSASAIAQRLPVYSDSLAVLFQTLPYLLTLIAVAGVIRRPRPPAAVGIPYIRS